MPNITLMQPRTPPSDILMHDALRRITPQAVSRPTSYYDSASVIVRALLTIGEDQPDKHRESCSRVEKSRKHPGAGKVSTDECHDSANQRRCRRMSRDLIAKATCVYATTQLANSDEEPLMPAR